MPRRKLIRHFEPRYGVSQGMVDLEAKYVSREHEDYLTLSLTDMRQKLHALRGKWQQADCTAEALVRSLPEREALAFQCLIVRDLFLILSLYCTTMRNTCQAIGAQPAAVEESPRPLPDSVTLPFNEWLFDPAK